jgi:DNA-binding XRE family transcriptional regulator
MCYSAAAKQERVNVKTIRELRRERGWTQFQLALAVGVQPQTVYLWESGRRVPQVPQLRKLGEVFGLCSDEIALDFRSEPPRSAPHQARAERDQDESSLGRDPQDQSFVHRLVEDPGHSSRA